MPRSGVPTNIAGICLPVERLSSPCLTTRRTPNMHMIVISALLKAVALKMRMLAALLLSMCGLGSAARASPSNSSLTQSRRGVSSLSFLSHSVSRRRSVWVRSSGAID
jgi:hypothetical protein